MKVVRAAAYARVSTLLGQDPELQLINIRKYAEERGYFLTVEYCDRGVSGLRESRPGLDQLVRDAKAGKFTVLIVTGIDRIGRSTRHLLNLIHTLSKHGVSLISIREQLDLTTPMGSAVLSILAAISQLERDLTAERIRSALAAKKLAAEKSGTDWRCGRPTQITPEIVKRVFELRSRGVSIRGIASALDCKISRTSIQRILKSKR